MSRFVPTSTFLLAIAKLEEFCKGMSREAVRDFVAQCQVAVLFTDSCPSRPLSSHIDSKYFDPKVFELRSTTIFSSLPLEVESIVYDAFVQLSNYYD